MDHPTISPDEICQFWQESGFAKWFNQSDDFDAEIKQRFYPLWQKALSGRLNHWQDKDDGLLALIIILDQFPRHIFRHDVRAYCSDSQARKFANIALERGLDKTLNNPLRPIVYFPFMHSENLSDQTTSVELFTQFGDATLLNIAKTNFALIEKFAHFPQRNQILGRLTTLEEQEYLKSLDIQISC